MKVQIHIHNPDIDELLDNAEVITTDFYFDQSMLRGFWVDSSVEDIVFYLGDIMEQFRTPYSDKLANTFYNLIEKK